MLSEKHLLEIRGHAEEAEALELGTGMMWRLAAEVKELLTDRAELVARAEAAERVVRASRVALHDPCMSSYKAWEASHEAYKKERGR